MKREERGGRKGKRCAGCGKVIAVGNELIVNGLAFGKVCWQRRQGGRLIQDEFDISTDEDCESGCEEAPQ